MKRLFILTLLLLSFAQVRAQTNGYEAKAEIYGFVGRIGSMTALGGFNVVIGLVV